MKEKNNLSKITAVVLAVSMILGSVASIVTNAFDPDTPSLGYIETIKSKLNEENSSFNILEIAPDASKGAMGYYADKGQEATANWTNEIKAKATKAERTSYASDLFSKLTARGLLGTGDTTPLESVGAYTEYYPWENVPSTAQELRLSAEEKVVNIPGRFVATENGDYTVSEEYYLPNLFNIEEWYKNLLEVYPTNNGFNKENTTASLSNKRLTIDFSTETKLPGQEGYSAGDADSYTRYGTSQNVYKMDVEPGQNYTLTFTVDVSGKGGAQMYLFYYPDDYSSQTWDTNAYVSTSGTYTRPFCVPDGMTHLGIRFGVCNAGPTKVTFSDVMITKDEDRFAGANYVQDPTQFVYGDASEANLNQFVLGEWYKNVVDFHGMAAGDLERNPVYQNGTLIMEGIGVQPKWNLYDAMDYYYIPCESDTTYEFGYKVEGSSTADYAQSYVWGIGYTENGYQPLITEENGGTTAGGDFQGGNGSFNAERSFTFTINDDVLYMAFYFGANNADSTVKFSDVYLKKANVKPDTSSQYYYYDVDFDPIHYEIDGSEVKWLYEDGTEISDGISIYTKANGYYLDAQNVLGNTETEIYNFEGTYYAGGYSDDDGNSINLDLYTDYYVGHITDVDGKDDPSIVFDENHPYRTVRDTDYHYHLEGETPYFDSSSNIGTYVGRGRGFYKLVASPVDRVIINTDTVFFTGGYTSNEWFKYRVLDGVEPEFNGSGEYVKGDRFSVFVKVITPDKLEGLGESLGFYDLIVFSSGLSVDGTALTYSTDLTQEFINSYGPSGSVKPYMSYEIPTVYDKSILSSTSTTSELNKFLTYIKNSSGASYNDSGWVEDFVYCYSSGDTTGTTNLANNSINTQFNSSDLTGYYYSNNKIIFNVNAPYYDVIREINLENTIREAGDDPALREEVSEATAIRYILNFKGQRVLLNKETITILDIEPYTSGKVFDSGLLKSISDFGYSYNFGGRTGYAAPDDEIAEIRSVLTEEQFYSWFVGGSQNPQFWYSDASGTPQPVKINIITMAASEVIADADDIAETYDVVYIGDSTYNMNIATNTKTYTDSSGNIITAHLEDAPEYNDDTMAGYYYASTGDKYHTNARTFWAEGCLGGIVSDDYSWILGQYAFLEGWNTFVQRGPGNDLTAKKEQQLKTFMEAGLPVIFADNLTAGVKYPDYTAILDGSTQFCEDPPEWVSNLPGFLSTFVSWFTGKQKFYSSVWKAYMNKTLPEGASLKYEWHYVPNNATVGGEGDRVIGLSYEGNSPDANTITDPDFQDRAMLVTTFYCPETGDWSDTKVVNSEHKYYVASRFQFAQYYSKKDPSENVRLGIYYVKVTLTCDNTPELTLFSNQMKVSFETLQVHLQCHKQSSEFTTENKIKTTYTDVTEVPHYKNFWGKDQGPALGDYDYYITAYVDEPEDYGGRKWFGTTPESPKEHTIRDLCDYYSFTYNIGINQSGNDDSSYGWRYHCALGNIGYGNTGSGITNLFSSSKDTAISKDEKRRVHDLLYAVNHDEVYLKIWIEDAEKRIGNFGEYDGDGDYRTIDVNTVRQRKLAKSGDYGKPQTLSIPSGPSELKIDNCSYMFDFIKYGFTVTGVNSTTGEKNYKFYNKTIFAERDLSDNDTKITFAKRIIMSAPKIVVDRGSLTSYPEKTEDRTIRAKFTIQNPTDTHADEAVFKINLYVDLNSDGKFKQDEIDTDGMVVRQSINGGTFSQHPDNQLYATTKDQVYTYEITRLLPSDYVGLLPWKIEIIKLDINGNYLDSQGNINYANLHDSYIDYCYIAPKDSLEAVPINVLQILPSNWEMAYTRNTNSSVVVSEDSTDGNQYIGSVFASPEFKNLLGENENWFYDDTDNDGKMDNDDTIYMMFGPADEHGHMQNYSAYYEWYRDHNESMVGYKGVVPDFFVKLKCINVKALDIKCGTDDFDNPLSDSSRIYTDDARYLDDFDMLVMGFADNWGKCGYTYNHALSTNVGLNLGAAFAIQEFIKTPGKSVLLTHDTTTVYNNFVNNAILNTGINVFNWVKDKVSNLLGWFQETFGFGGTAEDYLDEMDVEADERVRNGYWVNLLRDVCGLDRYGVTYSIKEKAKNLIDAKEYYCKDCQRKSYTPFANGECPVCGSTNIEIRDIYELTDQTLKYGYFTDREHGHEGTIYSDPDNENVALNFASGNYGYDKATNPNNTKVKVMSGANYYYDTKVQTMLDLDYSISYVPGSLRVNSSTGAETRQYDQYVGGYTRYTLTRYMSQKENEKGYDPTVAMAKGDGSMNPFYTNYVTQTNKGQITTYPYDINFYKYENNKPIVDENGGYLYDDNYVERVMATHDQTYQLNMNGDDITCWYCMSGNNFADIPNDATNAYYIYSRNNITYTGAGHTNRFTDWEAELFANTLIAAYRPSAEAAKVDFVTGSEYNASLASTGYILLASDKQVKENADGTTTTIETIDNEEVHFMLKNTNLASSSSDGSSVSIAATFSYKNNEGETVTGVIDTSKIDLYHADTIPEDDSVAPEPSWGALKNNGVYTFSLDQVELKTLNESGEVTGTMMLTDLILHGDSTGKATEVKIIITPTTTYDGTTVTGAPKDVEIRQLGMSSLA